MPDPLKKALRRLVGAVCVALLFVALLLGVLRVLMPLVPTFQEEIAEWTSDALGYPVEFARIEPSWGFTGPEFRLRGVRVMSERGGGPLLLADEILVGINLLTLLPGPGLNLDRMSIVGARLSLRRLGTETFSVQGRDPAYYPGGPARLLAFAPPELQLRDVWIDFEEPARSVRENLWLERLSVTIADGRIVLDGRLVLPEEYGDWLGLGADIELAQWTRAFLPTGPWRLHLEGRSVNLARVRELITEAAGLPLIGSGDFNVFVDLDGAEIEQLFGELDFADLWVGGGPADHVFDRLAGQFEWQRRGNAAELTAARLEAARNGEDWRATEISASWTLASGGELAALQLEAGFVRLEDAIPPLLGIAEAAGVAPALVPVAGDVSDLSLSWESGDPFPPEIRAGFSGLSLQWPERGLTLAGVDGSLRHESGAGNADLSISGAGDFAASWLEGAVDLTGAQAELSWRTGPENWSIEGNNLRMGADGMDFAGRFSLSLPEGGSSPVLDLSGGGDRIEDLPAALALLPWKNTRGLPFGWLSRALHAGRADGWNMQLSGPLDSFPFGGAVMRVEMALSDGVLTVHEAWPDVADLSGQLVLNGSALVILDAAGELAGVRWRDVRTDVRDLVSPVVEVNGESDDPLPALIAGLARIPMADRIHPMLLNAEASGEAGTRVEFRLPIADRSAWEIFTETELGGGELKLSELIPAVTNLRGSIRFTRAGVRARELQGRFLDQPLLIDVNRAPAGMAGYGYRLDLDGSATAEALEELFDCCALDRLDGQFAWDGSVLVPEMQAGLSRPVRVLLETDLAGLGSALPYPMNKPADEPGPTRLELLWGSGDLPRLTGRLGLGPGVALEFADAGEGWRISRGRLHFGDSLPRLPEGPGLLVDGRIDWLRPALWAEVLGSEAGSLDLPWTLDLTAGEVYTMGSTLKDQSIRVRPRSDGWQVELQGDFADGRLFWPRAGSGNGQLLADLNRLRLTLPDPEPQPPANPRSLPAGKVMLSDLSIGRMRLGEVRARYEKTAGGLAVNWFRTESPAFSSQGSAAWLVTDEEGAEQLGRLDMVLESSDVAAALEQLGYARGISGDRGQMTLSASWEGPPSGDFLARSNGTVGVEVEVGEVAALDPGGGRMLGVLSLARLPRRLALDFREVTEEGLPFDRLAGDFSLREGQAYTCNVGLQGAVAGLALFGRTGLQDRSYDQVAVVSPNLPDLLSLGGVIVGGTGLGATMLLLSQAFREPLQAISANYYRVGGSWDEPLVEQVLREEIDLGAFDDCARYLEEQLTDMPEVDWDALLSQAQEEVMPQQADDSDSPDAVADEPAAGTGPGAP
ncbi:MAG: hypothetical protein F4Y31_11860 [Gammaproteobacteria bacterium]|nr:hypothetical protein [Gammaproteobacteria bacterium]MYF66588.1 hypothetical protein [Gammaproteobacteria bacterium]MYK37100.1 hypothetical protein [Gammaproteobacteria bacterium]